MCSDLSFYVLFFKLFITVSLPLSVTLRVKQKFPQSPLVHRKKERRLRKDILSDLVSGDAGLIE